MVRPILYRNITELSHLSVKEVKQKFIAIVLPAVLIAKHVINEERKQIETLSSKESWSAADSSFYNDRKQLYKAGGIDDLLNRMITHPNSIVLAQAAVESGWGSARFFKEGNNLFGVWAYKSDEPRIAANEPEVYLRRYDNISQSITDYFVTIGRARPYRQFRKARAQSQDVGELL
ncbi:MAG: glucosaminidase domain-containing protein, partial [Bacteroidota bacterium]